MRVYDPEGHAHDLDPVDARECIAYCGYTKTPPVAGDEPAAAGQDKPPARKRKTVEG